MKDFHLHISGTLPAKNLASASKKVDAIENRLRAQGVQAAHIQVKGAERHESS